MVQDGLLEYGHDAHGRARQRHLGDVVGNGALLETRLELRQGITGGLSTMESLHHLHGEIHFDIPRIAARLDLGPKGLNMGHRTTRE